MINSCRYIGGANCLHLQGEEIQELNLLALPDYEYEVIIRIIWDKMHNFLLIYFNSKPLDVSSWLAAHHQEEQLCINSNWYSHALC